MYSTSRAPTIIAGELNAGVDNDSGKEIMRFGKKTKNRNSFYRRKLIINCIILCSQYIEIVEDDKMKISAQLSIIYYESN